MEVMKSLLNMAGSQTNKLSKLELSLKSFDGAFQSLEGDAYKLQKQSLKQSEELEDGTCTCPQMQAEQTEEGLDSVKECVEEVQETLDRIDGFVHPCWGAGWKEVVNVTYSHPGVECPPAWQDNGYDIKGCGRVGTGFNTIDMQSFPVGEGVEYDEVCGRIHGYGVGITFAFNTGSNAIEGVYVEGISLTHTADNLVHIWTFAASLFEDPDSVDNAQCPCDGGRDPPDYVGQNYFCESGVPVGTTPSANVFYGDDLLWDGKDCAVEVCCTRAGPPYFHSYLPQPTTADIDVRLMLDFPTVDVSITHIELYVRRTDP